MPLTNTNLIDFPIGFSEVSEVQRNNESVYYVEWLDDNAEFPSLNSSSNSEDCDWEVLYRKGLVDEEDPWSKVDIHDVESYLEIAEKDADKLKPKKLVLQPLWSSIEINHTKDNMREEDNSSDKDLTALYYEKKARCKDAIRADHLSKMENLRNLGTKHEGLYEMGTAKTKEQEAILATIPIHAYYSWESKTEALKCAAKWIQANDRWNKDWDKLASMKSNPKGLDRTEYSVLHTSMGKSPHSTSSKYPFVHI